MAEPRLPDVYGPGTFTDRHFVSVPADAHRILRVLAAQTPGFSNDESALSKVSFEGDDDPVIPGPVKSTPVAAALHAMTGILADEILTLRGLPNPNRKVVINTTHTALWLGSVAAVYLDHQPVISLLRDKKKFDSLVPDWQQRGLGPRSNPLLKLRATAIYPTKAPGQWYCLHGSLNPEPMLRNLGIDPFPEQPPITTLAEAAAYLRNATTTMSPAEIEYANLSAGHCGTICHTPASWSNTTMGKSLANHPLIDILPNPPHSTPLPPIRFPPVDATRPLPLQGIKVLELARIIAAPVASSILSSLGAEVIKVNAEHLPDMSILQLTLTAGKTTTCLDLRDPADLAQFQGLLGEADIFIQGFRPGVLDKFGLSQDDILTMAVRRNRGRPGWQQVADCASGVAYVMGRAYDLPHGEPVLPSLPVSDMTWGSWVVRGSLVGVDMFLLREEIGLYSREVVERCQERFRWGRMRGENHVLELLRTTWEGWEVWGKGLSILRPVVRFEGMGVGEEGRPGWRSAGVPYGFWDKGEVRFEGR
ncbi:CoA-transferase family III domain-containing protein [Apiosordaria backusii]|uniref:CoA-transferase family III domain-containing protein n=1 Tax=Apiosordaria backusii TaxID=314023 RepID=A0AA40DYL0_9PEZI|nr:CoA-transferase family III domain-containing protein [Apiosordaria backusii]